MSVDYNNQYNTYNQSSEKATIIKEIFSMGVKQTFPKGYLITRQGEQMSHIYYIIKGIVRGVYLNEEGKEVTKCFSAEDDIFGVEGYLYQRPATYNIECIEEISCIKLTYARR